MNKVSPKAIVWSMVAATACICTPQSSEAAGFFQENSQLDIIGQVSIPSLSPASLQFLDYAGTTQPTGNFGNFLVSGGTGTFSGLTPFTQDADYRISSLTEGQPHPVTFLGLGPIAGSNGYNVRFVLDNPTFTTLTLSGIDVVILEGSGRWQVWDSVNSLEVQGEAGFTSQRFTRLGSNPVSYSATFAVVPEPSEVLGLLVVTAGGALTLLRRRRLVSTGK